MGAGGQMDRWILQTTFSVIFTKIQSRIKWQIATKQWCQQRRGRPNLLSLSLLATWKPGLHLYLQKEPTFRPVKLHRRVCRMALGTGGGVGQRSSQSASGNDHMPSSMQVRVLLEPESRWGYDSEKDAEMTAIKTLFTSFWKRFFFSSSWTKFLHNELLQTMSPI